ncbi:MAG TPA: protein kinase [Gemmatimonadales bacterium]|nr:protein kinase [Gemmatimonadales bacterium]
MTSNPPERLIAALADRYRIERELGQGGMATVYLAQDLKHDRRVALKVLKPELAAVLGAERFVVEIKTTAALQHPHILPLFDSGTADGFLYYVMPYIEGETLRDKLSRETQLGIDEAVRITREVADALDYAHRHGVIHRDIKPENILLHDGRPMVADFGIALALSAAAGGRMTETGLSLGTPHYMSPEQATAEKELSNRSDIYSLGSVLYEMLTGNPPHTGASAQQIIMKIVTEEAAPVTKLRKAVPPNVAAAVAKAVERLPADRFETAAAFAQALGDPAFHTVTGIAAGAGAASTVRSRRAVIALAALAVVLLGVAAWSWLRPRPAPPVIRYGLALPSSQAPVIGSAAPTPAPDGSFLVYVGPGDAGPQLWMKRRDSYAAVPIPGTTGAGSFTLSPDGEWIGFVAGGRLNKLPVGGGTAVPLVSDGVGSVFGVAWLDDGTIVYASKSAAALMRVSANGGAAALAWRSDSLVSMLPAPLPGGRGVIFLSCRPGCPVPQLWVLDLKRNNARMLLRGGTPGAFVATGHLVYTTDQGGLFAVPFDPDRLVVTGTPVPLGEQLAVNSGLQLFRVSRSGTLVMVVGGSNAAGRSFDLVWVDRRGQQTPVDIGWKFQLTALANNHGWALSPDGSRLAIGLSTGAGDDIWVKPLPKGAAYRVTFDPQSDMRPRWTADGRFISFVRGTGGFYLHRADGSGTDSLIAGTRGIVDEGVVSPDNQWLLLREGSVGQVAGGRNITGIRIGKDTAAVPVLATDFDEEAIALSPDGKRMAYQSDETGRTEVFVRPFPNTDAGKTQVSSGGGLAPLWSRDGKELFYLRADKNMMAARAIPGATIGFTEPAVLFHVPDELLAAEALYYTPWDVARDGRFLMARLLGGDSGQSAALVVVENWVEELRAKLVVKR